MINSKKNAMPKEKTKPRKNSTNGRSADLYMAAKEHIQQGEWQAGLAAVDELLVTYPKVTELHEMRTEILGHLQQPKSDSLRNNQKYHSAIRLIKKSQWTSALSLVEELLDLYPHNRKLHSMQQRLQQNLSNQKALQARRRWKILLLASLVAMFTLVSSLFFLYVRNPTPVAEFIAPASIKYAPHYLFSIYGTDKPLGIAISKDGERLYVSEMGGARLIRIFDQNGNMQGTIDLPHTNPGERAPVYIATNSDGRVYVSDRLQHAVYIFTRDGEYLSTMLGPDTTLDEYLNTHTSSPLSGQKFSFNLFKNLAFYQSASGAEASLEIPYVPNWAPLGIRIDQSGKIYITDVSKDRNTVQVVSATSDLEANFSNSFDPAVAEFGTSGEGDGEFLFPNAAMADSQGRIYVSDGNNSRISVWDSQGNFLFNFGKGIGDGALSLPRGIYIDGNDKLFVVDAVGQNIKTYDVSGPEPSFLYSFGEFGMGDGMFNYPNDITTDNQGRVYIVDRENNRIQVWSF